MRDIYGERGVRTVIASLARSDYWANVPQMAGRLRARYSYEGEREREKGVSRNRMRFIRRTYSFLVHQKNVSLLNQLRAPGYLNGFWLVLYKDRFIPNFNHWTVGSFRIWV